MATTKEKRHMMINNQPVMSFGVENLVSPLLTLLSLKIISSMLET